MGENGCGKTTLIDTLMGITLRNQELLNFGEKSQILRESLTE